MAMAASMMGPGEAADANNAGGGNNAVGGNFAAGGFQPVEVGDHQF